MPFGLRQNVTRMPFFCNSITKGRLFHSLLLPCRIFSHLCQNSELFRLLGLPAYLRVFVFMLLVCQIKKVITIKRRRLTLGFSWRNRRSLPTSKYIYIFLTLLPLSLATRPSSDHSNWQMKSTDGDPSSEYTLTHQRGRSCRHLTFSPPAAPSPARLAPASDVCREKKNQERKPRRWKIEFYFPPTLPFCLPSIPQKSARYPSRLSAHLRRGFLRLKD